MRQDLYFVSSFYFLALKDSQVIIKASGFLVSQVQGIKSGYIMSLVSYALVITNSPRKKDVYKKLNEMLTEEVKNGL